jgi:branched-chain amino acid transport system ATP-binding protein
MWIEHIMHALVAVVDRIVVLAGGKIIADGQPDEVLRNPRVEEIYMGVPAG